MDKKRCTSCGETPKCACKNKDFTKAVIEIDNPGCITLMHKVTIPASLGDDTAVPPAIGKYKNVLLYYEANQKSYLYSSDGIPTLLANGLTDYEEAVNLPEINGITLIGDKTAADLGLQEEIANVEQFARFFDTVSDMVASTDLANGDYAKTLGYYAVDDGGGAYYKVRSTTPNNHYETLTSGLYAELIINPSMNVKQFGCKGDGTTDDTAAFNAAISAVMNIVVPEGDYLIDRFLPKQYQTVEGIGQAVLKLKGTAPQAVLSSDFHMKNIKLESTNSDLQWNRCSVDGKTNISIEDCSFENFRHNSGTPNAWGILINQSSDINIVRCYFNGNSQSDIAMNMGCENILIENCRGGALSVNIEPDNITYPNKSIKISNCFISTLKAQENQLTGTCTESLLIDNCTVGLFRYDGSTTTVLNSIINVLTGPGATTTMGGALKFVNSANFSGNMIDDPYLDLFQNTTDSQQPWHIVTNPTTLQNSFTTIKDVNGVQTVVNHLNGNYGIQLKHQDIAITGGKNYLLRITGKCYYPATGVNYASLISKVEWLDGDNTSIQTVPISMFRAAIGSYSEFGEQCAVLHAPSNATKIVIKLFNATAYDSGSSGTQSTFIRSVELFEFNSGEAPNELPLLPVRENRIFKKATQVGGTFNKYLVGDTLLFSTPSTYIGRVCIAEGYGNAATWKNFGALEP